jgi:hypothetical protein
MRGASGFGGAAVVLLWGGALLGACAGSSPAGVKGRVVLSSVAGANNMSRVRVTLPPSSAEAAPDDTGAFLLEDVEPGSYNVQVAYIGGLTPTSGGSAYKVLKKAVELESGKTADVGDLAPELVVGSVSGRVTLVPNGSPEGAVVTLAGDGGLSFSATVSSGEYTVGQVPLGTYTVTVAKEGAVPATGQACAPSVTVFDAAQVVSVPDWVLSTTDVSLAPQEGQTSAINGSTWTLQSENVTVVPNAGFIQSARFWLGDAPPPPYAPFVGTLVLGGLPSGSNAAHLQFRDGCSYESPVFDLTLVAP